MSDGCPRCGELEGPDHRRQRRLDTLGQLAAAVTHEYNNSIGVILQSSEMLLESASLAAGDRADVERIQRAATRARNFTKLLSTFGRARSLRPEALDCDALIAELLPRWLTSGNEPDVRFDVKLASAPSRVHLDRAQFETALHALVANAREAMPDGGVVTVSTHVVAADDAFFAEHAGAAAGDYVAIVVADGGSGILPEAMEQIFDPFFSTRPRAMGLGLAATYAVVKAAAGFVRAENRQQGGASLSLYLPVRS